MAKAKGSPAERHSNSTTDNVADNESITREEQTEIVTEGEPDAYSSIYRESRACSLAEAFMRKSRLQKEGHPSVYFLQSTVKESRSLPLRWFTIGQPTESVPRKTILLMGATGSGKSTLVDAMVNYILGVQLHDPYRFKIVPKESSSSQAQSQTTCITSYTIYHTDGMTVPYSVSIIDTPGFGDTGGLERDSKITENICTFLAHRETGIDDINAVCFVASSADTRLTWTQKYIISSVMSFLGKDVASNIRLLCTFSDGGFPPVVRACQEGDFPFVLDASGRPISYSKFNNSVVYARNDDCDQVIGSFWQMAVNNFRAFFDVLQHLPAKPLEQLKIVAAKRLELEGTFRSLERLLNECKDSPLGGDRSTKSCASGMLAYNCSRCRVTCELPNPKASCVKFSPHCPHSTCRCVETDHAYEDFTWQMSSAGPGMPKQTKTEFFGVFHRIDDIRTSLNAVSLVGNEQSFDEYVKMILSRFSQEESHRGQVGVLDRLLDEWMGKRSPAGDLDGADEVRSGEKPKEADGPGVAPNRAVGRRMKIFKYLAAGVAVCLLIYFLTRGFSSDSDEVAAGEAGQHPPPAEEILVPTETLVPAETLDPVETLVPVETSDPIEIPPPNDPSEVLFSMT